MREPCVDQPDGVGAFRQAAHLCFDFFGRPEVVGVDEGEKIRLRVLGPMIAGSCHAGIRLGYQAQPGLMVGPGFDLPCAVVSRAIIDHDNIEISVGLRANARDCCVDRVAGVVHRDDDTDQWGGRAKPLAEGGRSSAFVTRILLSCRISGDRRPHHSRSRYRDLSPLGLGRFCTSRFSKRGARARATRTAKAGMCDSTKRGSDLHRSVSSS